MFESTERLTKDAVGLLDVLRGLGDGRYACVVDRRRGVVLETPEPDWPLRELLQEKREALFALPAAMAGDDGVSDDLFAGWHQDDFFLAFLNGRAVVVVACEDAGAVEAASERALHALVDRLLRIEPSWRLDPGGRGLFMGRPRVDVVVARRDEAGPDGQAR